MGTGSKAAGAWGQPLSSIYPSSIDVRNVHCRVSSWCGAKLSAEATYIASEQFSVGEMRWYVVRSCGKGRPEPSLCISISAHTAVRLSQHVEQTLRQHTSHNVMGAWGRILHSFWAQETLWPYTAGEIHPQRIHVGQQFQYRLQLKLHGIKMFE
jgi:hypothetical protein